MKFQRNLNGKGAPRCSPHRSACKDTEQSGAETGEMFLEKQMEDTQPRPQAFTTILPCLLPLEGRLESVPKHTPF